jgi:hypothetical protein
MLDHDWKRLRRGDRVEVLPCVETLDGLTGVVLEIRQNEPDELGESAEILIRPDDVYARQGINGPFATYADLTVPSFFCRPQINGVEFMLRLLDTDPS